MLVGNWKSKTLLREAKMKLQGGKLYSKGWKKGWVCAGEAGTADLVYLKNRSP